MNARDVKTIRGYVQSLPALSGREEAAKVAVVTDDGTEYHVLHKGAGIGMAVNINANVEVTGCVLPLEAAAEEEAVPPAYLLSVKNYRLTDGFDDPWYDDSTE